MIDLGKFQEVTAFNFKLNFLLRGWTKSLIEVKKITFFNALNDGVDQTFWTFFSPVLFPLNCEYA